MDWRDQGILLSARRHGENAAIIEMFTPEHGRHAGVVRGGLFASWVRRRVSVRRAEEHLGVHASADLLGTAFWWHCTSVAQWHCQLASCQLPAGELA